MTFSQQVKEELLVQFIEYDTAKIELMAAFKAIGNLVFTYDAIQIELKTSQIKLTKRLLEIIKNEYPKVIVNTSIFEVRRFNKKSKLYVIKIETDVKEILYDLKFIDDMKTSFIVNLKDITNNLISDDERQVYVRTFFCCCGSVNDPQLSQRYHLEITCQNQEYLVGIQKIVLKYNIKMKISKRKNNFSLYLNKSEEIADFLKFIKTFDMLFVFEDFRMTRDMSAMYNRLNNADIANEVRQLESANIQIEAINKLKDANMYEILSEKAKIICELRIKYPEDSLAQLAEYSNGEISKSNIIYRLKKIIEKADSLDDSK